MTVTRDDVARISAARELARERQPAMRTLRRHAHLLLSLGAGWRHRSGRTAHLAGPSVAAVGGVLLLASFAVPFLELARSAGPPVLAELIALAVPLAVAGAAGTVAGLIVDGSASRWRRLRALTVTALRHELSDDAIVAWVHRHHLDVEAAEEVLAALLAQHSR